MMALTRQGRFGEFGGPKFGALARACSAMSQPLESQSQPLSSDGELSLSQFYEKHTGKPAPQPAAEEGSPAPKPAAEEDACEYCKDKAKACPMCDGPKDKAKGPPALFSVKP